MATSQQDSTAVDQQTTFALHEAKLRCSPL